MRAHAHAHAHMYIMHVYVHTNIYKHIFYLFCVYVQRCFFNVDIHFLNVEYNYYKYLISRSMMFFTTY